MSAVSALSVASNHALDAGASGTEPGVAWLARASAVAASQQADGVATQGVDRTRPALVAATPALEASGRATVRGVKMMMGYDRVNRQMRQGELVTVQHATGQPTFWLRGGGTSYRLLAADGQPITDLGLAEARADQLIGNGAAARLREVHLSNPVGAEVKAPANRTSPRLSIDLESHLSPGEPDASATRYKLPANARRASIEGCDRASREVGVAQLAQVVRAIAEGRSTTSAARSNVSIAVARTRNKEHHLKRHLAATVLPRRVTHTIFGSAPGSDDWWLLQANRETSAQIMRLAERLHVADVDRWATGVLASVDRGGAADGPQMLRAAQMNALGTQLGSPTQPAALSVSEIRQLASARALIQPTATAQESRATTGQRPTPPSVSPRPIGARTERAQAVPVRGAGSPAVDASVSTKQNLQRQLRALGIECDDPTTIRTGPGSHAVVGTTKGGDRFEIAIRSNGSLESRSAGLAGGHTVRTDPSNEAGHGGSTRPGEAAKKKLLLTGPKNPYQSVISMPPPSPESIPRIPQPTKVIGAGEVNVIYEHPTNPNLVVAMTNAKVLATFARTGQSELASVSGDVNTLRWLGNAGLPVIKPVGLVRIGDRYGVVKPKIDGGVFSKDPAPASTDTWRQLVKSHGREIIQQLRQIDRTMTKLGVVDFDFQFYIDSRGQVALYDPGFVTHELDPSRRQHRITELWVDRIKTDMLHIRYGKPVIGPVTGDEQKNMPKL